MGILIVEKTSLHYAVDTDKIISTAMLGNGAAATGYMQHSHPEYQRAAHVYGHDPEKAKRLLKEAGVPNLNMTLMSTDTGWVNDIMPLLKESFDAIGVHTTLDIGESGGQYSKVERSDFHVMAAPGDPSVFGNDTDLLLSWFYASDTWMKSRARWAGTAGHKKVRSFMEQAARSSDQDTRMRAWGKAVDILSDELPLYPVLHRKLPTAWHEKKLEGFHPLPTTGLSFLDVSRA